MKKKGTPCIKNAHTATSFNEVEWTISPCTWDIETETIVVVLKSLLSIDDDHGR
jgi:hypothetical protein